MWQQITACLQQAVSERVAPAITLLAWHGGHEFIDSAGAADNHTIYDLASLTKPLSTTLLALNSHHSWHATLGQLWPEQTPRDKQDITIYQLLTHSAGFSAWQPFYKKLLQKPLAQRRQLLKQMLLGEPLQNQPGQQALYSDLGFMLLGFILEEEKNNRLDFLFEKVCKQLGMQNKLCYLPINGNSKVAAAPCGSMPDLGRMHIQGQVEDENAFALNGVAAHAGLFGTASAVKELLQKAFAQKVAVQLWDSERIKKIYCRDASVPTSTRSAGFDTPSDSDSAAGSNFPPGLIGHLGFTGVSVWYQPQKDMGIVLLTNRVAYGRDNWGIRELRPKVHSLLWPILESLNGQQP